MGSNSGDGSRKVGGFARLPEENIASSRFAAKATTASCHEPSLGPETILKDQSFEMHDRGGESA